jgi:hypothetical protein
VSRPRTTNTVFVDKARPRPAGKDLFDDLAASVGSLEIDGSKGPRCGIIAEV